MGASIDAVRTPDDLLEGLPDFPFASSYREIDGLRLAHLDEGEGRPVVFFHGEPTWSFLWRKVIPPVRDAGYRCIAPDYAGFGRSDKPTDVGWYTYDRHVELISALLEELDVRDATAVVHDWGGPIGLRLAVEHPDRFARIVIMETGPFTGHQRMSDAWFAFRDFVRDNEDVPIGALIRGGCRHDPGDEVIAAYDAPYIDAASKAGARAFPLILPTTPEAVGAAEGKRVADALRVDERPSLVLWADSDPILPFKVGERVSSELNLTPPRAIADAGHFLQEDAGPEIGAIIADWLG
ncbi:MAG TPA: haloalkane dehalogenase [Solirubrobacterales bacterium]|jgi:haloalkane dehalogenase|nr:haloalkane dehalogenase [Solirubrobacterales bacterium]